MVWVHPGGLLWGSSALPLFDGSAFARDGVVLVSVQYRLNVFGFLYLDELFANADGTGNLGLLDQIAALEWVRENIHAFGGDAENVTIFGESAGGMSVGTLLTMPAAQGLFHRAIVQSGFPRTHEKAAATRLARHVLGQVGVEPGDWEALQAVPTARLLAATEAPIPEGELEIDPSLPFLPVVDGVELHAPPLVGMQLGRAKGIDLLVGTCADEAAVFVADLPPELLDGMLRPRLQALVASTGWSFDDLLTSYRQARPALTEFGALIALGSDATVRVPSMQFAAAQLPHHDGVWMFSFAWETAVGDAFRGAPHMLDVPFVFDQLVVPELHGSHPPQALATAVHDAWVRFASVGDPTTEVLSRWPRYGEAGRQAMVFDLTCAAQPDLPAEIRRVWEQALGLPALGLVEPSSASTQLPPERSLLSGL
jgi:para-nitrobenzyl esterase